MYYVSLSYFILNLKIIIPNEDIFLNYVRAISSYTLRSKMDYVYLLFIVI